MADVVFVAALLLLTGVTALFIVACDRMIGRDEDALAEGGEVDGMPKGAGIR